MAEPKKASKPTQRADHQAWDSSRPTVSTATYSSLPSDRWLIGAALAFVGLLLLYWSADPDRGVWLTLVAAPGVFLPLAAVAALVAAASTRRQREKRFWRLLTGSMTLWSLAVLIAAFAERIPQLADPLGNIAFAGFYALLIVAVETQPHRRSQLERLEHRLMAPAAGFFVGGWLAYFPIVTELLGLGEQESTVPALLLFSLFDLYLAGRLLQLATRAKSSGWREIYSLLAAASLGFLLGDLFTLVKNLLNLDWHWNEPANVFFAVPLLLVLAAARLGARGPRSTGRERGNPIVRPLPTVLWTLSFPLMHTIVEGTGWLEPAGDTAREILVMVMVGALGGYALVQRHLLAQHSLSQWRERRAVEDALKESEQDLLLILNRNHHRAELERHEQTYRKAFQASPDGLLLTSWGEGRIVNANRRFCELVERSREDLVGRLTSELDFWRQGDRDAMLERVERTGSLHMQSIDFHPRPDVEPVRMDLTFEKIETLEGQQLLTMLRQATGGPAREWTTAIDQAGLRALTSEVSESEADTLRLDGPGGRLALVPRPATIHGPAIFPHPGSDADDGAIE